MKKSLIRMTFILLMLWNNMVLAEAMDPNLAPMIREQLKTTFFAQCMSKVSDATEALCNCLSDKIAASISDESLNKCVSGGDDECLKSVIMNAGKNAFTEESVKSCAH